MNTNWMKVYVAARFLVTANEKTPTNIGVSDCRQTR